MIKALISPISMKRTTWLQAGLLGIFLLVDITKSALLSWSHANKDEADRPSDFNVIFTKDIACMCAGFLWLALQFKSQYVVVLAENASLLPMYLPIALLFVGSQNAAFAALQLLDIGTFKLLVQTCTPITAVLSWLILNKNFTLREILAIAGVFAFSIIFYLSKSANTTSSTASAALYVGVWYAASFVLLSSVGGVVSEKILKSKSPSLTVQYFFSKLASVVVTLGIFVFSNSDKNFFANFDYRTILVIIEFGISGFIVTAITKYLSSTSKNITQASGAACAQLLTMVYSDWSHKSVQSVAESNSHPLVIFCAIGIVASVAVFHFRTSSPAAASDVELGTSKVHHNSDPAE